MIEYPQPAFSGSLAKISIVTPSFNQAHFLEATIRSVLSQSYPNLEYVIIDGGSSDGSVDIIRKYSSHLHYWCSEPDGGQYDAINKGFSHCSGEVMAWLNSDDMYYPWALRTIGSIMSDLPQVCWITTLRPGAWDREGFCTGVDQFAGVCNQAFRDGMFLPTRKHSYGWVQQESTFWRRSLWEAAGGAIPTDLQYAGDFALWSKFADYAEIVGVNSPIAGFRYHEAQKTNQGTRYETEAESLWAGMHRRAAVPPLTLRRTARRLRLHEIPAVRKLARETVGYTGQFVVQNRTHVRESSRGWSLIESRFL